MLLSQLPFLLLFKVISFSLETVKQNKKSYLGFTIFLPRLVSFITSLLNRFELGPFSLHPFHFPFILLFTNDIIYQQLNYKDSSFFIHFFFPRLMKSFALYCGFFEESKFEVILQKFRFFWRNSSWICSYSWLDLCGIWIFCLF